MSKKAAKKIIHYAGDCTTGEWLEYTVDVAATGQYTIDLRFATPKSGLKAHVTLDGANVTGTINIPNTGSWINWQTVSAPATLSAGQHVLRVVFDVGGVNFNWIDITTIVPGMAASDIETQVTDVLEDALDSVSDVKFVSSVSRENTSSILVRFEQMPAARFDKRVIDLRREIQNKEDELPDEAESPFIFEVTTANAYPTAMIVVSSVAEDENLRRQAELVKKELERIKGVDRILPIALNDPEIAVDFDPRRLEAIGVPPSLLTDSIRLYYRDVSAGSKTVDGREWLVRLKGKSADPRALAALPLIGRQQEIRIGDVAEVRRDVAEPRHQVRYQGRPAVMLAVTKKSRVNTLDLIDRLNDYIARKNRDGAALGVSLALTNDSTEITRKALRIMQNNALLGLMLVLLMTWLFLGFRIAFLTTIGIPFILAGTFWLLQAMGHTLNVTVLLGVVISLGMLVDDAVVVVEGIYYRMQRGMAAMRAALEALREVAAPVTSAVLTTIAAFLPLMLLPGILGEFMKVIPIVVTTALAISLVEAFWMLPVHVQAIRLDFDRPSAMQRFRERALHRIRIGYTRWLIKAMRRPRRIIAGVLALFTGIVGSLLLAKFSAALSQWTWFTGAIIGFIAYWALYRGWYGKYFPAVPVED